VIAFEQVSKTFRVYRRPSDWLREKIMRRSFHQARPAIKSVSFAVDRGEVFGVIGRNGAGKSTLLKLVMGVLLPDHGTIRRDGRVTGLLELGTGFNQQFSGWDNIAFNGAFLGMSPAEIEAKRADIVAFSELEGAIHDPLRTYSTGMSMRLAFSIAVHADPACMVVDEALSVGDIHFQQKCMRRLKDFKATGGSILFVSHDLNAVTVLCDRAMVLEDGAAVLIGSPEEAVQHYYRIVAKLEDSQAETGGRARGRSAKGYGTFEAEILAARLRGVASDSDVVTPGEMVEITLTVKAATALDDVTAGFQIHDRFGQIVFGTNTFCLGANLSFRAGETRDLVFSMTLDLGPGHYSLSCTLHRGLAHTTDCFHWRDGVASFEVAGYGDFVFVGLARLKPSFATQAIEETGQQV
jgi:lipopolysaccharide transport system ATP-binding protein